MPSSVGIDGRRNGICFTPSRTVEQARSTPLVGDTVSASRMHGPHYRQPDESNLTLLPVITLVA